MMPRPVVSNTSPIIALDLIGRLDLDSLRRVAGSLAPYRKVSGLFLCEELLNIDYALLIQQDPSVKKKNRYSLTHFHVKIDWPIADAAEDLARSLRYISKDIYEKGDKYAEDAQKKFFEPCPDYVIGRGFFRHLPNGGVRLLPAVGSFLGDIFGKPFAAGCGGYPL